MSSRRTEAPERVENEVSPASDREAAAPPRSRVLGPAGVRFWGIMVPIHVAAFAVLNLFIGVIVEAVQTAPREAIKEELDDVQEDVEDIQEAQEDAAAVQQRILDEVRALRAEVAALRGGTPPA